jgi:hypothetical protein
MLKTLKDAFQSQRRQRRIRPFPDVAGGRYISVHSSFVIAFR